jgi:hypothetical protein
MAGESRIEMIRQYCNYLETHLENVADAWDRLQEACTTEKPVCDDFDFWTTHRLIEEHDLSKFSAEEFIAYVDFHFSPYGKQYDLWDDGGRDEKEATRIREAYEEACRLHRARNPHHWQNWKNSPEPFPGEHACHLMCMVADCLAVEDAFGAPAEDYLRREQENMQLPDWAGQMLDRIFEALRNH